MIAASVRRGIGSASPQATPIGNAELASRP